jgi:hypothetical protein
VGLQVQVPLVGQVVSYYQVAESAVSELEVMDFKVVYDLLAFYAVEDNSLLAVFSLNQLHIVCHDDLDDALLVTLLIHDYVLLGALVQLDALLNYLVE